jgi:hypothetical protein
LTPIDVPTALSWASMSATSNDELHIDYGNPSSERPYGVHGSPVSKYHIEVATGANEIQRLWIVSTTMLQDGSFGLQFGGEKTTDCTDIGTSASVLEQALESLSAIDDIKRNGSTRTSLLIDYTIALDLAFYRDADTILLNNPNKDEFSDTRDYDGAWWLASTAVLAFLTFEHVINSNRLFFLHAFT